LLFPIDSPEPFGLVMIEPCPVGRRSLHSAPARYRR
jgi:hypothetical protein